MRIFFEWIQSLGQKGMFYANAAAAAAAAEEESKQGISWFELRALTPAQIVFYIIVAVLTVAVVIYVVWRTTKNYLASFKDTDFPVETIKLHVKTDEEREADKKYEDEMDAFLKKKRYIKGRK